jgi:hypothetical protein
VGSRARLTKGTGQYPRRITKNKHLHKEKNNGGGEKFDRKMPGVHNTFRVIRAFGVDFAPVGVGRFQGLRRLYPQWFAIWRSPAMQVFQL